MTDLVMSGTLVISGVIVVWNFYRITAALPRLGWAIRKLFRRKVKRR